jgi:uridine kinase
VSDALRSIAARVVPGMRVAVDGVTASGKTTFADTLAKLVPGAVRVTIDDFHRPPPHEYYPDSFDFDAFRAHIVAARGTLIVDGVFLLHPELRDLWDLTVFLAVDRELARERGIERDASWMENARERYATRYVPGETRYLEEVDPESVADVVVENTDFDRPRLRRPGLGSDPGSGPETTRRAQPGPGSDPGPGPETTRRGRPPRPSIPG